MDKIMKHAVGAVETKIGVDLNGDGRIGNRGDGHHHNHNHGHHGHGHHHGKGKGKGHH